MTKEEEVIIDVKNRVTAAKKIKTNETSMP